MLKATTFAAESIENHGTLEFAPVYDEEDEDEIVPYLGVKEVVNKPGAKMNIQKDAIIGGQMGALTQYLKLTNEIDNKDAALPHGAVTVNGILVLANGSTNDGDITVTTTGSLRGTFTNNKKTTYPVGAVNEEDIKNRYTPTITNNGEIFATDVMTNNGKVVNNANAEISCSNLDNNAAFNNAGLIELADKSNMLITDNNRGEIKLSALDQTGWAVKNKNGTVSYETKAADNGKSYDFSTVGKEITKLYVTGDFGFTKYGKLNLVEVTKSATVGLPASTVGTLANLTIKEGATVTAASAVTTTSNGASVSTLIVEKNARLTINADNRMYTTTVDNKGRIYVGGEFETAMLEEEAKKSGGEFRNTVGGENGNIKFGTAPDPDADKKEALEEAIQALVPAYIKNSTQIGSSVNKWSDVTLAGLQAVTWGTSGSWTETPWKAVMDAYQALKGEAFAGEQDDLLKEYETVIKDAIAAEQTAANTALKEAMGKILPTTWLNTDVYIKDETTGKITKNNDGTSELKAGWQAYINGTFATDNASNKALWLSAKSYVATADNDAPAYSYINNYAAGAGDYEVMEALIELVSMNMSWFGTNTGSFTKYTADDFKTYNTIKNAMILIYNKVNGTDTDITPADRKAITDSGILDWYDGVVKNWLYTGSALSKLNDIVQDN